MGPSWAVKPQRRCQALARLPPKRTSAPGRPPGTPPPRRELGPTCSRSPRSSPLRSWARRQTSGPSQHRRARGGAGHTLQSSGTRGLAATPEPFPGLRQVLGGPGTEEGLAAPSRSWRKSAAHAPYPSAEVPSPRRTCSLESYLWALAGVLSSPCSSTTPWQPRLQLPALPGCASEIRPRAVPSREQGFPLNRHPGLPRPHAPSGPRAAGIPTPGRPC